MVNQHEQNGNHYNPADTAVTRTRRHLQPAHDEEWMEYIDWGEVEAQASGSSSSGA